MSKATEQIVSACVAPGNIGALETMKALSPGLAADAGNRTDCKVGAYLAQIGEEIAAIKAARRCGADLLTAARSDWRSAPDRSGLTTITIIPWETFKTVVCRIRSSAVSRALFANRLGMCARR